MKPSVTSIEGLVLSKGWRD